MSNSENQVRYLSVDLAGKVFYPNTGDPRTIEEMVQEVRELRVRCARLDDILTRVEARLSGLGQEDVSYQEALLAKRKYQQARMDEDEKWLDQMLGLGDQNGEEAEPPKVSKKSDVVDDEDSWVDEMINLAGKDPGE